MLYAEYSPASKGTLPCLTMDGKIILEAKDKVAIAPDGNGGIYAAVSNKGIIRSLKERGIFRSSLYWLLCLQGNRLWCEGSE
ncbi:hypothetical protein G6F68_018344 [Rhizopus microsporus]|nr:hypothetical protein G6F68_018344 [Rhizopus microsporus]